MLVGFSQCTVVLLYFGIVRTILSLVLLAASNGLVADAANAVDAREIVRRSVQVDDRDSKLASDYTYVQRDVVRELDGQGNVKSTHSHTRDVLYIGGKPFRRLIEKDGKPLPAGEERKERERMDKAVAESNRMTDAERAKRAAEHEQTRARQRESFKDIPEAFDFTLLREEKRDGRDVYVFGAKPRDGYRGKHRELLSKMQGTLWIDKSDYHWVRAEAETLGTISFGLFLARLAAGSHMEFEQTRVNGEIWLPKRATVTASARLALVKKVSFDQEVTFSGYRKFQTDSRVVSATEIEK